MKNGRYPARKSKPLFQPNPSELADPQAEKDLLGAILDSYFKPHEVLAVLPAEPPTIDYPVAPFSVEPAQCIWEAMMRVHHRGQPVRFAGVRAELPAAFHDYLADLQCPIDAKGALGVVADKYRARQVVWEIGQYQNKLPAEVNPREALAGLGRRLEVISTAGMNGMTPRGMWIEDDIDSQDAPLEFHIQDILPQRGKMTVSAPTKLGKSFFVIQLGFMLACGDCEFLGWKFGSSARVLYLQPEIMDKLLRARFRLLRRDLPYSLHMPPAKKFGFYPIDKCGPPELMSDSGKAQVEMVIQDMSPEVLILDGLSFLFPGLEENDAGEMSLALRYLTSLTVKYNLAIILVHHHGKGGMGSRGSSAFEAWPETDLQISFVDKDAPEVARIDHRLRCAWGRSAAFWRVPTKENVWFETMPDGWEPEGKKDSKKKLSTDAVVMVLKAHGAALKASDLYTRLRGIGDCSLSLAEKTVAEAVTEFKVMKEGWYYMLCDARKS